MAAFWTIAAIAEFVAYGRLAAYERQSALGMIHRLRSPILRALYPALGVSDLRHLLLRYVVWLMIPGLVFAVTWIWLSDRRATPPPQVGESGT